MRCDENKKWMPNQYMFKTSSCKIAQGHVKNIISNMKKEKEKRSEGANEKKKHKTSGK